MDSEKLVKDAGKTTSQGRKKSPSIRRDIKKITSAVCQKLRLLKYGVLLLTLFRATEAYRIQPDIFQQTDNKPVIQITQPKQNQHIVFEEVGKMATQMKYIHVIVPLNISVLYTEAEILKNSLIQMANKTTSQKHKIPFTKAVRDTGDYGLLRLQETMEMVNDLNLNLPHNSSQTHHFK